MEPPVFQILLMLQPKEITKTNFILGVMVKNIIGLKEVRILKLLRTYTLSTAIKKPCL